MIRLSVLDLAPIHEGSEASDAFRHTVDLARHCEQLGYQRYWLAEHHGMPGIASAATAVLIGHVAGATTRIRVGAGGIMLPNHSPLVIAEQFGTLNALYPGRIDLGLGRAPGTDQVTAHALRRSLTGDVDHFPDDVVELMRYFEPARPGQAIVAVPGAGQDIPVWILGSSLFGAQLAAALGLPFAFASHFAPTQMMQAIALYRERFQPSRRLDKPYVMLGYSVFAADSDAAGKFLASSMQQAFVRLRKGERGKFPPPVDDYPARLAPHEKAMLDEAMSCAAIGSPDTVKTSMRAFIERTGADELMVTSSIFHHEARKYSYEIAANVAKDLAETSHAAG
jgi:luciferase family oxidoreductase group 1